LTTAILQLVAMEVFQAVLALSGLVPGPLVPVTAWAVSSIEAVVGSLLVFSAFLSPVLTERALWVAALVLIARVSCDAVRVAFGTTLPGPYFGVWSAVHPAVSILVGLVMLAVVVILLGRSDTNSVRRHPNATPTMPEP
jgi:hypothetical protein